MDQQQPSSVETPSTIRRGLILVVLCAAQAVSVLNFQIVILSLPLIQRSLSFSPANLQWVVTANALMAGGLLLFAGRLADLYGHRRLFIGGFTLFGIASLLCGLAPSQLIMIVARALQGVSVALIIPAAMALLIDSFAEGPPRNRALGVWGASGAVGGVTGVLIGGALVSALGWRWIFFLSALIAAAPVLLAPLLLREHRERDAEAKLDLLGAITGTADVIILVLALNQAAQVGFTSLRTIGLLALALVLLLAFRVIEVRVESPLVPLRVFRRRTLARANLVNLLLAAAANTPIYFFTLYMQDIQGYSPIATGLAFLPTNIAIILGSPIGTWLANVIGSRRTMIAGLAVLIGSLLVFANITVASSYYLVLLPALVLLGLGLGIAQVGTTIAGMKLIGPASRGMASGLLNTSVQIGTAIGLAILVSISTARTSMLAGGATASPEALVGGFRWAFYAGIVFAIIGTLMALLIQRRAFSPQELEAQTEAAASA